MEPEPSSSGVGVDTDNGAVKMVDKVSSLQMLVIRLPRHKVHKVHSYVYFRTGQGY